MNNFNNILTKTESLTTLQGGIENSESGEGGNLLDTCKLYITEILQEKNCKISQKKEACDLLRPPLNRPMHYLHWNIILFHHLRAVKNPVWQFTGKVWQFDVSSNVNVEGKSFSVCLSFPGNYYKLDFACATLKIFLLNDRKQVFGWLSLNPEMISTQI